MRSLQTTSGHTWVKPWPRLSTMITSWSAASEERKSRGQAEIVDPKPAMSSRGGRGLEALPNLRQGGGQV